MAQALETLREIAMPGKKIAVLGDMLELGTFTDKAHLKAGALAGEVADVLITVGKHARLIAEEAQKILDKDRVFHFDFTKQAAERLKEIIQSGDTVLIKGSQSMRMERIVEEILLYRERKEELLARQDSYWLNKI
jgi:UDP-N-acetylmuramoyl-tripeptide--D-alanyl-D-alanine ligase